MPVVARHSRLFLFVAILLLGINLRPILAVVGAMLDQIQQATGLDDSQAGLLTTLPILAMGICALYGGWLQRHLGEYRGILLGISIITVACLVRFPWDTRTGLLVSAALGGVGIALIQALVPSFIKRFFLQRSSLLMGLYTTGIMAGAAVAAATASPLSGIIGWSGALAVWGILALIALLVWRKTPSAREPYEQNAVSSCASRLATLGLDAVFWHRDRYLHASACLATPVLHTIRMECGAEWFFAGGINAD